MGECTERHGWPPARASAAGSDGEARRAGADTDRQRSPVRRGVEIACALVVAIAMTACAAVPVGGQRASPAAVEQPVKFRSGDVAIEGRLFVPAGTRQVDRRPAVVLMHGCSGMYGPRGDLTSAYRAWAERLAGWGYTALVVDSLRSRGVGPLCELTDRERTVHPWNERTVDAYSALDYLASRRDVDPGKIFLMGWSHGGSTVMGAIRQGAPGRRAGGPEFKAAIAYYPGCTGPLRQKTYRPVMPLLILHGEDDDWVPAAPCVEFARKARQQGFDVETITYPGARHAFDSPTDRIVHRPNVYNPRAPGERGAYVGGHAPSREKAIAETKRFLAAQSGGRQSVRAPDPSSEARARGQR